MKGRKPYLQYVDTYTYYVCTCIYKQSYIHTPVGGLEHVLFFHILGMIIPTDEYLSEGLKPPTRYTICIGFFLFYHAYVLNIGLLFLI